MKKFYVIKKTAGYAVKSFRTQDEASDFAARCCKNNNNSNYTVCKYEGGQFVEL
ncbi:MAG TPA: hypothetical protein PK430_09850 [Muribaculum sp.]|nr:hypothetical protein [Muribaculum sp.]